MTLALSFVVTISARRVIRLFSRLPGQASFSELGLEFLEIFNTTILREWSFTKFNLDLYLHRRILQYFLIVIAPIWAWSGIHWEYLIPLTRLHYIQLLSMGSLWLTPPPSRRLTIFRRRILQFILDQQRFWITRSTKLTQSGLPAHRLVLAL